MLHCIKTKIFLLFDISLYAELTSLIVDAPVATINGFLSEANFLINSCHVISPEPIFHAATNLDNSSI